MGRKYWNTIIPYAKSGRIQKVINYEYDFPLRLAFFLVCLVCFIVVSVEEIKKQDMTHPR